MCSFLKGPGSILVGYEMRKAAHQMANVRAQVDELRAEARRTNEAIDYTLARGLQACALARANSRPIVSRVLVFSVGPPPSSAGDGVQRLLCRAWSPCRSALVELSG